MFTRRASLQDTYKPKQKLSIGSKSSTAQESGYITTTMGHFSVKGMNKSIRTGEMIIGEQTSSPDIRRMVT